MMNEVYKTLPDDRPITSICVVEDVDKCPNGYVPVSRTYDQDADADLWKDGGFFGKKCTRYLCLSKTVGIADHVVEALQVMNEKEVPPKGYKTLAWTSDTTQKAWRKKQLCFKYSHVSSASVAVTDIIILSRMKKAPEEFSFSGEINGMSICYKIRKYLSQNGLPESLDSSISYGLYPGIDENANSNSNPTRSTNLYPMKTSLNGPSDGIPESQIHKSPLVPVRPAPKPPTSYSTISGYCGLEGVPFILNPKWSFTNDIDKTFLPKPKTRIEIDYEYSYEFRTERET